ncbi:MAG: LLM class flavin-dependent oxidoreductase [Chloroflexi bacterium]|nr:LLM class flavin-dependent oxidoreductase [Chloroflexota bacterium]
MPDGKRIGLSMVGSVPVREGVAYAAAAEEAGFYGFWVHETYGLRDAHSYLAAAAMATKHIRLGAGCLNTYTRNAALLAMTCATLAELTDGRFRLGLGTALNRLHDLGFERGHAVASYHEIVDSCRRLLRGETVTVAGKVVSLNGMKLLLPPSEVPIYLATKGPLGLAMAARIADGQLDGPMTPAPMIAAHMTAVRGHGARSDFDFASYIFCSIDEDPKQAREAARRDRFLLYLIPLREQERNFRGVGLDMEARQQIGEALARDDVEGAAALVTDEILDAFVLCGSPHQVLDQLQPYLATGVSEPILQPLQPSRSAIELALATGKAYLASSLA